MGELLRVGTWLDDAWRIDARLARGGVATVYAGTDREGRRVAVKVLHAELSNHSEVKRRFAQEGYLANQVEHPRVVRVIADGTTPDGQPYLVMDLLVGEHFDERRNRLGGRLEAAEVVHLGVEVLKVLEAAHAKGIVHRDIKPDNVYLTTDGQIMVLDFGIARMRQTLRSEETATGLLLGTAEFMSPEQALGRSREIDEKVDIWGVGATMFLLLAGEAVHPGETIGDVLRATAGTPARPLGFVAPDVPPFLSAVVDRALAFEKSARWESALAMRQALERCARNLRPRAPSGVFPPVLPQPSLPDVDDDEVDEDGDTIGPERTISMDDQPTMTPAQSPVSEELQQRGRGDYTPDEGAPQGAEESSTVSVLVPSVPGSPRLPDGDEVDVLLEDDETDAIEESQTEVRRPTAEESELLAVAARPYVAPAPDSDSFEDETGVQGLLDDDSGDATAVAQVPSQIAASQPPAPPPEQDDLSTITGLPPSHRERAPDPSVGRLGSYTMPMPRQVVSVPAMRAAPPPSGAPHFPLAAGGPSAPPGPPAGHPYGVSQPAPAHRPSGHGPPPQAPFTAPRQGPPVWVVGLILVFLVAVAAATGAALADHLLAEAASPAERPDPARAERPKGVASSPAMKPSGPGTRRTTPR